LSTTALTGHAPAAIDLNQPGTYLHWDIFTVSVANLVLIAVMVAIFGAALLLPFPGHRGRHGAAAQDVTGPEALGDPYPAAAGDERMWTARVRRRVMGSLPPDKLLPDRQPPTSPPGSTCSGWVPWPRWAWPS
jgi:hypothetical protein